MRKQKRHQKERLLLKSIYEHKAFLAFVCLAVVVLISFLLWNIGALSQRRTQDAEIQMSDQSRVEEADVVTTEVIVQDRRTDARVPMEQCPIRMPACEGITYLQGANTESWKTVSDLSCRGFATELLLNLRESGFSLAKADFLDLFGEAWGCAVKSSDDAVYVISLMPEHKGEPRGIENKLEVRIVHIAKPQFHSVEAGGK